MTCQEPSRSYIEKCRVMGYTLTIVALLLLSVVLGSPVIPESNHGNSLTINGDDAEGFAYSMDKKAAIPHTMGYMSGWFTENCDQIENPDVLFFYSGPGCAVGFMKSGYLIKLHGKDNHTSVVKVSFDGSNSVMPVGQDQLSHRNNYFYGHDPSDWRTNVTNYGKIIYTDLYNGIDLVFYLSGKGLKYDWIVDAGADPDEIVERFTGIVSLDMDKDGSLIILTEVGVLNEEKPYSYQEVAGELVEIRSSFAIDGDSVDFTIGEYDPTLPLIIDPLIYSTYLGGSGSETSFAMAIDANGNAFITGQVYSEDFPTSEGAYDDSQNGDKDVFIFKLNDDGTKMIFSTFIGGAGPDEGLGIVVDDEGHTFITGRSESTDFPTTGGVYDETHNGDSDVVVLKLDPDGSDLVYSTYVGGNQYDVGYAGLAIDDSGNAFVAGHTNSANFPTTEGAYDRTYYAAGWDGFCFKLNPDASDLDYSTYFGGYDYEGARAVAIDGEGNAYLTGDTTSSDYPTTTDAYDETYNGGRDGFILELNNDGSDLIFSTFLGGTDDDLPNDLELANDDTIWITGYTVSDDYPLSDDAYDSEIDERDFMLSQLSGDGSDLEYSTFAGGSVVDEGWTLAVNDQVAYVAGRAYSEDFPVTGQALQKENHGGLDAVIFRLDTDAPAEEQMTYATYLGGSGNEASWELKLSETDIYVTGLSASEDFPVTPGAFQENNSGGIDVTVWKMNIENELGDASDDGGDEGNGDTGDDDPGDGDDGENGKGENDDEFFMIGRDLLVIAGSITALLVALAVIAMKRGRARRNNRRKRSDLDEEAKVCPRCEEDAEWVEDYDDYYCWDCKEYLDNMR